MAMGLSLVSGFGFAAAPPVVSQLISVTDGLRDEYNALLKGTDLERAGSEGEDQVGCLVHVYRTADGVVYPPDRLGTADTRTDLLVASRIGAGVSILRSRTGKFSLVLTPRPASGTRIFVRVFNAASVEEASFYQDSQVFTVSWSENENFIARFDAGIQPLDDNDDDQDGLHNSWEKSYGTDLNNPDTDGDGFTDTEEVLAGTDPASDACLLKIHTLEHVEGVLWRMAWRSARGRQYEVQRQNEEAPDDYETIAIYHGNDDDLWATINGEKATLSSLRIRVSKSAAE
ncbi:MAG TPA: thrombospondin type 3 repeat-containing protein [Kiritimatiellia bacterium]|nr:thrombospondin type 3 repeat-containing protein [Kiritimatiellia bacterium]HMP95358.1 thrombospondin type 3 repeat-containing protein [Kiritimatiellia bacterium]